MKYLLKKRKKYLLLTGKSAKFCNSLRKKMCRFSTDISLTASLWSEMFHIFPDKVKTRNFSMITVSRIIFVQAAFFTFMWILMGVVVDTNFTNVPNFYKFFTIVFPKWFAWDFGIKYFPVKFHFRDIVNL